MGQLPLYHSTRETRLWAVVVILLIFWLVVDMMAYTAGGLIHALLVTALIVVVVRLVQGRVAAPTRRFSHT